ncbi:MAG TPA: TIM barrel protein [Roseiflexaceae bacterium]|nr:TIM barrel protein [Roseiflexaceae bacterium]
MARIKHSAAWWCYVRGELTPERFVRAAAEIGYDAVEIVDPSYWQLVKDHGLAIASVVGHKSLTDGLNRRENHARIAAELRENIAQAARWGIPNLVCFSGNRGGRADDEGAEITAEGLRAVARAAEDAGVTLVLELLNSKVDHKDYQCDHTDWGVRVVRMIGSPRVKLLYDIYHMQIMEGDVIRTIRDNHAHFGHYHTGGNPGRNEIDETQELNYPAIVHAIADTGYAGYLGQEFVPRGDPIAALRDALERCTLDG